MNTPNHPSKSTHSSHNTPTQSRLLYTPTSSFEKVKRVDSEGIRTPNRYVSRSPINSISSLQSAERNEQLNRVQRECKELIQNSRGQLLEKLREKMSNGACLDIISDEDDFEEINLSLNPRESRKKQPSRPYLSLNKESQSETKFSRNPSLSHSSATTPSKAQVISELAHSIVSQVANHSNSHAQLHPQHSQSQFPQSTTSHQFQQSQKTQRKNLYGPRMGDSRHMNSVNTALGQNPWSGSSTLTSNTTPILNSTSYFTPEELLYLTEELEKELSQEFAEWEIEAAIEHESERATRESSGGSLMGESFYGTNGNDIALAAYCEAMDERDEFLINQVQELEDVSRAGVIAVCPGCFKGNLSAELLLRPSSDLQTIIPQDQFVPQISRTGKESEWQAISAKSIRVWCRCGFQVLLRRAEYTASSDSALDAIRSLCEQAYFSHISFGQGQQNNPCRSQLIFSVNNSSHGVRLGSSQDPRNYHSEPHDMSRVCDISRANQVCISCPTCSFSTGILEL